MDFKLNRKEIHQTIREKGKIGKKKLKWRKTTIAIDIMKAKK